MGLVTLVKKEVRSTVPVVVLGKSLCLEGYVLDEDEWQIGTQKDLEAAGARHIGFSESTWESEKDYFKSAMDDMTSDFEKELGESVEAYAVLCEYQTTDGKTVRYGYLHKRNVNPIDYLENTLSADDVQLIIYPNDKVTLNPEGEGEFQIYPITKDLYKKLFVSSGSLSKEEMNMILQEQGIKPFAMTKMLQGYFNPHY